MCTVLGSSFGLIENDWIEIFMSDKEDKENEILQIVLNCPNTEFHGACSLLSSLVVS